MSRKIRKQNLLSQPGQNPTMDNSTRIDPTTFQALVHPISPDQKAGVSGTPVYGGWVVAPEQNPRLIGVQKYRRYDDIFSNLSIVAAGVRYFLDVIAKSGWKFDTPDDKPETKKYAEIAESMLYDMTIPWHRVVRKAVMYKFYGFGIQEWTAKKRPDGYIGLQTIESRPQRTVERWDVDLHGVVFGVIQRSPQTAMQYYIPRSKMIYLVDDSLNDSPEGFGLFRQLVKPSHRLERYEELEGYGFETDLRGVPIGRAPFQALNEMVERGDLTKDQRDQILAPMKNFITNHVKGPRLGLMLDSMTYTSTNEATTPSNVKEWDVELLRGGSESLRQIADAITRVNNEIARILGVELLMLGGAGRGSMALSKDKSDNFYTVVDSSLKELASGLTKDLLPVIWNLNGWPVESMPRFKTDSVQLRDIQSITTALQQMAQAGAVLAPDDPAILEIRDLLGLSRPDITGDQKDVLLDDGDN